MVLVRFACLVLGLLYLLHALTGSSTWVHGGSGMHGYRLMEDVDDVPSRKMKLEGRKMLTEEVPRREVEEEEDQLNGGASKISGYKDPNASKRAAKSQDHFNKMNNSPMLKHNTLKEPVHFPSTKPHEYFQHLQDSNADSTKSTTSESQGFIDDSENAEIVNLMQHEYSVTIRSPPKNNHEPND